MNELLVEYIKSIIISEKVRSKNIKSKFGNKFDINKLQKLDNIELVKYYANLFLEKLGEGSSRAAYTLTSRKVLKVAINKKGISQNEAEVDVFTNPTSKPIVATIYKADPEYKWVISDLVKPLGVNEFKKLTGLNWYEFSRELEDVIRYNEQPSEITKKSNFVKSVIQTAKMNNLLFGDLGVIDHWGKTSDGKVILLDYGFTGTVWEHHYKSDGSKRVATDSNTNDTSDKRTNYTTNNSVSDRDAATKK